MNKAERIIVAELIEELQSIKSTEESILEHMQVSFSEGELHDELDRELEKLNRVIISLKGMTK